MYGLSWVPARPNPHTLGTGMTGKVWAKVTRKSTPGAAGGDVPVPTVTLPREELELAPTTAAGGAVPAAACMVTVGPLGKRCSSRPSGVNSHGERRVPLSV